MRGAVHRETLEKFYSRVYRAPRPVRVGSMVVVAGLTTVASVWPLAWSAAWLAAYFASELWMMAWWRRIQPRLRTDDAGVVARLELELIGICAVSCAICAMPSLATPFSTPDNRVLGALLAAGILMVGAAEHSLRKGMFLFTMPAAAAAFVWNAWAVGHGFSAFTLAFIAVCYVANARAVQVSNTKVYADLVRLRADADQASVAKSEFLAAMSYEIRTPLNGVLGMTQVLLAENSAPAHREKLQVIAASGQALLGVLNGILDISKIESGRLDLDAHPFDIEATVRLASAPFEALIRQKGLRLDVEVAPAARGTLRGDGAKLAQVLGNLLSNALKFTEDGGVTLSIDAAADGLAFAVRDTGIGVPADKLAHIFEKFTQADASTTRRFGGSGLGLAISQRLVALMGGELTVESEEGRGAAFSFTLPLRREPAAPYPPPPVGRLPPPRMAGGVRVLAADDNATNRLLLEALLTPLGREVTSVNDGEAAVAAWRTGGFELVLMDIQMPLLDGVAATAEIRRLERAAGAAPATIIALTANAMSDQVAGYLAAGFDGHVAKPIQVPELLQTIDRLLAGRSGAQDDVSRPALVAC